MSDKKIKVAYVINSLLVAGAETVVLEMASHLDRQTFSPVVYVMRDYGIEKASLEARFKEKDVPIIFLKRGARIGIRTAIQILRTHWQTLRPDIIHLHLPDAVIAGGVAGISMRIPFIIHEHQTHQFHSWKIRLAYRVLRVFSKLAICYAETVEQELFGSSEVLVTPPSNLTRNSYTIHNGIDIDRVKVVQSTVDRDAKRREFGFLPEDIVIVSTARFTEWKGHRLLIEAFAAVASIVPRARLLIVGDGPLFVELKARVRELKLEDRITMPGVRSDVYEILAAADIFSLAFMYPTDVDAEAIGIAGFEAMAFGLPVIVGDYMDARNYLGDNMRGMIIAPRNKQALCDAIITLVNDGLLRKCLGTAAHEFALRELNWNTLIKIYERIYTLILSA